MGAADELAGGEHVPWVKVERTHADALRIAQSGYAAFARAKLENTERVRWDLCCAAPEGSASARALPETRGRPLSVFGRRPASSRFPSRPVAAFPPTLGDPVTEWGFAKPNPLDLMPLQARHAGDRDLQDNNSQFARRARDRQARKDAILEERRAVQRVVAANADVVPVSKYWWLCCCFMSSSERRRTGKCMPKTGPKAEAARKQRIQTAMQRLEEMERTMSAVQPRQEHVLDEDIQHDEQPVATREKENSVGPPAHALEHVQDDALERTFERDEPQVSETEQGQLQPPESSEIGGDQRLAIPNAVSQRRRGKSSNRNVQVRSKRRGVSTR